MARLRRSVVVLAALAALALPLGGCDDDYYFRLTLRVNLSASPVIATSGVFISFTFTNTGEELVQSANSAFEFVIREDGGSGGEVARLAGSSGTVVLDSEEAVSVRWDQRDSENRYVPPGKYAVTVNYRSAGELRTQSTRFTIN